jgi:hypothetical protein
MSPVIRVIIDGKVAKIDGLLEQIGIKVRQGDGDAALEKLEQLKKEIADVKRQLLG